MWDLSSPTRAPNYSPCIGRQSLNHCTSLKSWSFLLKVWFISKSDGALDKRGSGTWNFLSPRGQASPPGSGKSCDSQGETNVIVKGKGSSELYFCAQNDDDTSFCPAIINRSPQNCNLKSHPWGVYTSIPFSQLRLQIAVTQDFPVLFKSRCRFGPNRWCIHCYFSLLFLILLMSVYWN